MPIYAYKCSSCGHAKDVLQKVSDEPLTTCPACGAQTFTKQVTAAGFQLKGSGWYATDFRNGSKPAVDASKTDVAKTGDAKTADAKTADVKPADAKPAEKSSDSKPADSGSSKKPDAPAASDGRGRSCARL